MAKAKTTKSQKPAANKMVSEAANKGIENTVPEKDKGETVSDTEIKETKKEAKEQKMVKCHCLRALHGKDENEKHFYYPCTIIRKAGKIVKENDKAVMLPEAIAKRCKSSVEVVK